MRIGLNVVAAIGVLTHAGAAFAQTHYGVTQGWCTQNGGHFRATGQVGTNIGECTILPSQGGGGGGGGGGGYAPGPSSAQRAAAMFGLAAGIIGLIGQAIDQSNQISDREYRDRQAYDIEQGLAAQKQALERALHAAQYAEAHQRAAAMEALATRMRSAAQEADRSLTLINRQIAANAAAERSPAARRPNPFARPPSGQTAGRAPTGADAPRSGISGPSNNRGSAPGSGTTCNALGGCDDVDPSRRPPRQTATPGGEGASGGAIRPAVRPPQANDPPPPAQANAVPPGTRPPSAQLLLDAVREMTTPGAETIPAVTRPDPGPRFKYVDTCGPEPVPLDVVACYHSPFKVRVAAGAGPGRTISKKELLRRLVAAKRKPQGRTGAESGPDAAAEFIEIEAPVETAASDEPKLYGYWDHTVTESVCRSDAVGGDWRVPTGATLPSCLRLSETRRDDTGVEFGLAGSDTDFTVREMVTDFRNSTQGPPAGAAEEDRSLFDRANDANRRALRDGRVGTPPPGERNPD